MFGEDSGKLLCLVSGKGFFDLICSNCGLYLQTSPWMAKVSKLYSIFFFSSWGIVISAITCHSEWIAPALTNLVLLGFRGEGGRVTC